jgi:hypothetical protein
VGRASNRNRHVSVASTSEVSQGRRHEESASSDACGDVRRHMSLRSGRCLPAAQRAFAPSCTSSRPGERAFVSKRSHPCH